MLISIWIAAICLAAVARTDKLTPYPLYATEHEPPDDTFYPMAVEHTGTPDLAALSSALDLQDQEIFVWAGEKGRTGESMMAVMELDTHGTEKVLNMQRFASLVAHVECGSIETRIEFKSREVFSYAATSWSWVNSHPDHIFVLFTHWQGCLTDEGNFKPFHFHTLVTDAASSTITLQGATKIWKEAAHTFTLEVGDPSPSPKLISDFKLARSVRRRSAAGRMDRGGKFDFRRFSNPVPSFQTESWSFKKNIWNPLRNIWDYLIGRKRLAVSFGSAGLSAHPVAAQPGISASSHCKGCSIHGSLGVHFVLRVSGSTPIRVGVSMTAHNVGAKAKLDFNVKGKTPASFAWGRTLATLAIPGFTFEIPNIFWAGAQLKTGYGFATSKLDGEFELGTGVDIEIPDGAMVYFDFLGPNDASTGSWSPQLIKQPIDFVGNGHGVLAGGISSGIGFSVSLFKMSFTLAAVQFKFPSLSFHIGLNSPGTKPCGQIVHSETTEVDSYLSIGVSVKTGYSGGDFSIGGSSRLKRHDHLDEANSFNASLLEGFLDEAFPIDDPKTWLGALPALEDNKEGIDVTEEQASMDKRAFKGVGVSYSKNLWSHRWPWLQPKCFASRAVSVRSHPRELLGLNH
ncbi:hypothetical protein MVLG_03457 [Microbotryum lychnidis-dioicae p1A1 Lamole]|uniref:Uncharacterized protein n=1 Tax=Microbotryum lychnidis-dioicae (strain p1A1 Lamole / MvSl-1064) TaxID=683840 RepID=U5H891_USTV1|nr:hypothetical protein MVLG_03457 [Microbotryum lychnidis-dioicae p1A1 Lamole]|eukprot:KDE06175.1 hypothetical protein MVLG_03457 [Microbotryum lychnidis-dioicae p1A1 Lamole]